MFISIQNFVKTVYIQEKLSVCIMGLRIQNDNYFKKAIQLYYSVMPIGSWDSKIFTLCE